MIRTLLGYSLAHNISDKMLGPAHYSRNLYLNECVQTASEISKGNVGSRPITSNIGYPTGKVSHFLHSQLKDAVLSHEFDLKDSIILIRQPESMNISQMQDVILTSADVAALYPSINLEDGLRATKRFMTLPLGLQRLYIRLAQFVLENHYVKCEGLPDAYLQKIGTAMRTNFSVT